MRCIYLILCSFLASICLEAKPLSIKINTPHAILINAETGQVLFEKNAHTLIHPASTTKIATTLYILEHYKEHFDQKVSATLDSLKMTTEREKLTNNYAMPAHYLEPDGVSIGIRKNESFTFQDLLYGALIASANDACNVMVSHLPEDFDSFASNLTEFVKGLGCKSTKFSNAHGLSYPDHLTTAYDMAMIAKEAIKNPLFREIAGQEKFFRPKTNLQAPREYVTLNKLLVKESPFYYPKAFGIKTGYTRLAKYNLVAAAKNEERTLIAALHKASKSSDRYLDAIKLFEAAFNERKTSRLLYSAGDNAYKYKVKKASSPLIADFDEDVYINYFPSEEPEIRTELEWLDLSLPIHEGDLVGFVAIYNERDALIKKVDLKSVNQVDKKLSYVIIDHVLANIIIYILIFVACVIGLLYLYRTKKPKS